MLTIKANIKQPFLNKKEFFKNDMLPNNAQTDRKKDYKNVI